MQRALFRLMLTSLAACASARDQASPDGGDETDAADGEDAGGDDGPGVDAAAIDAAAIDARPTDARPTDAAADAAADAAIDAMCTPTWHDILGNGAFESGVAPWTQTSTIIRDAAAMPFSPHAGTYAALFGASNNANDVLVQNITVPASATAVRVRGYQCFVTEDPITDADSFTATLETPGGAVLETLFTVTNSGVAPICFWQSFTWNSPAPHAGQAMVLRMRGRTNLAFLTRFVVDDLVLEWLGC